MNTQFVVGQCVAISPDRTRAAIKFGDDYYVSGIHGGENGSLAYGWVEDGNDYIMADPLYLRSLLHEKLAIPFQANVYITCCYPKQVMDRYSADLAFWHIYPVGDWDTTTSIGLIVGKNKTVVGIHWIRSDVDDPDKRFYIQLDEIAPMFYVELEVEEPIIIGESRTKTVRVAVFCYTHYGTIVILILVTVWHNNKDCI